MTPRTQPPAPGWSRDGHRIKAPLAYSRGIETGWVQGGVRIADGVELTVTAPARNPAGQLRLLTAVDRANPAGELYVITDTVASHTSAPIRAWLEAHPRVHQVFIPTSACWLNLQEAWWRLLRRAALAGQSFVDDAEIETAVRWGTAQLNRRAQPWAWGRPPRPHRTYRRRFVYLL